MVVHFHAIGDAAITKALDAVEEARKEFIKSNKKSAEYYSPTNAVTYQLEVASLMEKMAEVDKNAPIERQAQLLKDASMKKLTKTVSLLLVLLMLSALLCACGSSAKSVPVSDLVNAVGTAIGQTDLSDPGESYVKGYMKHDASELGEYLIQKNVMGTSIDEFGIFKAGSLSTDDLKAMVEGYLQILNEQERILRYDREQILLLGRRIRLRCRLGVGLAGACNGKQGKRNRQNTAHTWHSLIKKTKPHAYSTGLHQHD